MKLFSNQPAPSPALPIVYEGNRSYLLGFTIKVLLLDAVAQDVSNGMAHWLRILITQLPIIYLYYQVVEERAFATWVVRAWNKRLGL